MNLIYNNNKKKWTHEPKPKKHTHTHTHTHSFFTYLLTDKLGCSQVALNLNHLLMKSVAAAALKVGTMTRVIISGGGGRGERERESAACAEEYLVVVIVVMGRIITGWGGAAAAVVVVVVVAAGQLYKQKNSFLDRHILADTSSQPSV
jgi:hypothetical protein